jgi:hypothetical protein
MTSPTLAKLTPISRLYSPGFIGAPEKIKMRTFRVGLFGCKTH